MHRSHRFLVVATLLAALGAGAIVAAPADPPEPKTLIGHLEAELEGLRLQIVNAGARMKGGAVSMGAPPENLPDTPATQCCGQNVVKIQARLKEMSSIWGELRECYRSRGDAEAEIQANFVREDASSLLRALGVFVESPSEDGAAGGYGAMMRSYRHVMESSASLTECGEPHLRGQ